MSSSSEPSRRKTVKLVVSPQYFPYGYQDYTGIHDLSEPLSFLRIVGTTSLRDGDMTLLFRGRRIKPEEETMTLEALMKTVLHHLGHNVDILVLCEYG
jgi:hypothetical protein